MILIEIPLPHKSETAHLLSVDMLLSSPKKVVSLAVKKKRHVRPTQRGYQPITHSNYIFRKRLGKPNFFYKAVLVGPTLKGCQPIIHSNYLHL